MRSGVGWDVTRTGRTVRIDVNGGLDISEDASTAIFAATIEHLLDEDVGVVLLDGSALGPVFPNELGETVALLEPLAERYGKEFIVVRSRLRRSRHPPPHGRQSSSASLRGGHHVDAGSRLSGRRTSRRSP
jgi:hypothetical protein